MFQAQGQQALSHTGIQQQATFPTGFDDYKGIMQPVGKNDGFRDSDPGVCVLIRTFFMHRAALPALIGSLAANNYPNLNIFLIDTEGNFEEMPDFVHLFNLLYNKDFVHLSGATKELMKAKYPEYLLNDFGYRLTDMAMEELSAPDSKYNCDYFVATNGDNLYNSEFIWHTMPHMRKSVDIVGVEFASHYCYDKAEYFRPRTGCYAHHYTQFKLQRIDVGAALIRKQKLLDLKMNFIQRFLKDDPKGERVERWFCDGFFFQDMISMGATHEIVHGVYFWHQ